MDVSVTGFTVIRAVVVLPPKVAVTLVTPAAIAETLPVGSTVAKAGDEDAHVAVAVTSVVVLSE
jgi:hypothetical protein